MISCRVSRRECKAQQGTTAAETPLPSRLFLAAERVGAWQTWREERVASSCFARRAARQAAPKAAEAGDLQGWRRDRSGEVNHAPPNTTDDGATGHEL